MERFSCQPSERSAQNRGIVDLSPVKNRVRVRPQVLPRRMTEPRCRCAAGTPPRCQTVARLWRRSCGLNAGTPAAVHARVSAVRNRSALTALEHAPLRGPVVAWTQLRHRIKEHVRRCHSPGPCSYWRPRLRRASGPHARRGRPRQGARGARGPTRTSAGNRMAQPRAADCGRRTKGSRCATCTARRDTVRNAGLAQRVRLSVTHRQRQRIYARDGYRCLDCGGLTTLRWTTLCRSPRRASAATATTNSSHVSAMQQREGRGQGISRAASSSEVASGPCAPDSWC